MNLFTLFAFFALIGLVSQVSAIGDPNKTVFEILVDASSTEGPDDDKFDYDIALKAIERAGLVDFFSDPNAKITLFAPRDKAFFRFAKTFGYPVEGRYDEEVLWKILVRELEYFTDGGDITPFLQAYLLYHVAPGKLNSDDIAHISNSGEMINTFYPFAMITPKGKNGTILDHAADDRLLFPRLTDPLDIEASNGVIHTINNILRFI
eukprot:CAMPEP_0185730130 /NCGR_PEP_ID=MMETSP1171-20130828/8695_1 /TAXON_ID=374046 /ORGANISM="Helicotheca tamensis, Strain CCMP826" /LENGTH=206 /DNA_ID=CAMNT_0028399125 /DNA_START=8 /DNA_END=628 /DNA_ORIENTATION=+